MLGSDLVNSSLRLIGAIASGETPNSDEAADGFNALTQLLDSWSADELLVHATRTSVINLSNGVSSYAVTGGRTVKILSADVITGGNTFPVAVVGPDGWAAVPDRNAASSQPRAVYCDYAFPTPAVLVAPIPNLAMTLNLYCLFDLATLANSGVTFAMPEAYYKALRYNLAIDLAPEYGIAPSAAVIAIAAQTKGALEKLMASNRAGKSELAIPPVDAGQ
ncbi:MAG: hypothetical protein NVSMB64_06240 [Candidatus Velthaea sp.]